MKLLRILAMPAALICIGAGLWQLETTTAGLSITHATVGNTPVTVFRAGRAAPAPVVVIAHGFAGSQQLMFGRNDNGYLDERGPALGLLFFGLTLLGWPLAALLPQVSVPPTGAGLKWRRLLPVAIAPAILTPLILWKMPTNFLPILVGGYITIHFALYGLLTLAGLSLLTRGVPKPVKTSPRPDYAVATWADPPSSRESTPIAPPAPNLMLPGPGAKAPVRTNEIVPVAQRNRSLTPAAAAPASPLPPMRNSLSYKKFIAATILVAAYSIFAFGAPLDRYVLSFSPIPERVPLILAVLAGTLPFFIADEWLTRGQGAARGGYPVTKLLFLTSLALAVLLNFKKLFFLILIIPVILIFFIIYGFFSGWVNRRTGNPLVSGAANALAFAWAIAATFPLLSP
jgi:hypothetical protein